MKPAHRPRGAWRFLDDPREAARLAWEHCRPPLFVIGIGLVHVPVFFHPRLGEYRWVILALGCLSLVVGVAGLHLLMSSQDRLANARARSAAKAQAARGEADGGPDVA